MALTRAQIQLRQDIAKTNKRIARLQTAGISSPAVERLLTAVGTDDGRIKLPKNATLSQEIALQQAIKRFLKAATSTVRGYKVVEKHRAEGTLKAFTDRGFSGTADDVDNALRGAKSFKNIASMFSIGSSDVQTEFVRGAQRGETSEQVMDRLEQMYGDKKSDDRDWWDDDDDDIVDVDK